MHELDDRRNDTRREDDREWQRIVDHQLVTAMTAIQVIQDQIKEVKDHLRDMEITLHGQRKNTGLVSEYERHDDLLTHLNSVVFQDSTGKKGLVNDVQSLLSGEHRAEYRLKFWAPILVAAISLVGLLATNWERITNYVRQPDPDILAQKIEEAKHPRPIHRHYTIIQPKE